jgi:hypothetical protein
MQKAMLFFATLCVLSITGRLFGQSCRVETHQGSYAGTVAGITAVARRSPTKPLPTLMERDTSP